MNFELGIILDGSRVQDPEVKLYVFYTLDLPDLHDEWESLFCDGNGNSSIHCEQLIT